MRFAIVGPGRAGRSFARALSSKGWIHHGSFGRHDRAAALTELVDIVLLTVPDDQIEAAACALQPGPAAVLHTSGAKGLDAVAPHTHCGSVHPLMSLPDDRIGAERLASGVYFAVAGDERARAVVDVLGGKAVTVADDVRATYHATAAIAANHLVAMCAQVERLAEQIGVPVEAYWALMSTTLDNVRTSGAVSSLTGPAARGDSTTLALHLDALPPSEHDLYRALASEAARLAGRPVPPVLRTDRPTGHARSGE